MITSSILLAPQNKLIGYYSWTKLFNMWTGAVCHQAISIHRPLSKLSHSSNIRPILQRHRCDGDLIQNTYQTISQYEDTLCIVGSACQTMILCHICPKGGVALWWGVSLSTRGSVAPRGLNQSWRGCNHPTSNRPYKGHHKDHRLLVTIVVKHWPLTICSWSVQCYRNVMMNTAQLTHWIPSSRQFPRLA